MKKILFICILVSLPLVGNPVVDVLNKIHNISDQYWQNQGDYPIKSHSEAMDFNMRRFGGLIEGAGELADIVTLATSNHKLMRIANMMAAFGRMGDVVVGSFPQLPYYWVDENNNPVERKRAVMVEEPTLRFWPTAWQKERASKTATLIPFYLASLGINQIGKVFDVRRAYDRLKNARLLTWYNTKLSKKERLRLHIEQVLHAAMLVTGVLVKQKQQHKFVPYRYPWLIGEALVSFLRRWRMRHVQNDLLDRARMAAEHEGKSF